MIEAAARVLMERLDVGHHGCDLEEIVVPDRGDLAAPLQRRIAISDSDG
jgi:hypothetical protein